MALSLKDAETDRLAREVAKLTGESLTEAVRKALAERLERERRKRGRCKGLAERLDEIALHIVAILEDEPERAHFVRLVAADEVRLLSAVSRVGCTCVIEGRKRDAGRAELDLFLREAAIEIAPVTADQAGIACEAFRRFGRGRHPAGLNIGDTFAYALARATGEPLLFKGDDFAKIDIAGAA